MKLALLVGILALVRAGVAHLQSNHFPGYGFSWYSPVCGYACYNILSGAPLTCTTSEMGGGHSHMGSGGTSPECRANDSAFLTTLALCMNSTCDQDNTSRWKRENFWDTQVTGDPAVLPKWSYSQAVDQVTTQPTKFFNASSMEPLNETVLVSPQSYQIQSRFMVMFDHIEMLQARYCIVLVTVGFGTPIFFSLLTRLPLVASLADKLRPYLIYPSSIGTYSVRPLPWLSGNAPTLGQALYIAMFMILNVVLSAVNYASSQPHPWYFSPREETLAYIGYRTGHIAYALLPLLILFSSRNNFLLWITDWSYSTYLVLHRWVARIFTVQAIIHSIVLLLTYQGTGSYPTESKEAYWLWGIVATVLACAMLVLSHLYFRRLAYEIFLSLHIIFAIFVIVGCWYHVVLKWGYNFYDNWLYAAIAVWFFDRLVRVIRVARNGTRRATITELGPDHIRVDIDGIRWASKPGAVAYVYFPTLHPLRPWENHPFSVNSTALFNHRRGEPTLMVASNSQSSSKQEQEITTSRAGVVSDDDLPAITATFTPSMGITFVVKKKTGVTSFFGEHKTLPCWIEGPYPQRKSSDVLKCDRLLLVGGGIGITGLLAWVQAHPNVKLAWSVKPNHDALVQEADSTLKHIKDKEILIGQRFDLHALLKREADAGYARVGVVVCGPGEMCDEVRAVVSGLGRGGSTSFHLEVDAFSW